ncbi:MAG: pyridoxal phosphate-dependent aminotransferase family protein [Cytophagales bacterium]|nr:MAG: pyridoxal phosphate-dependent aminotransferase family protein [Cytophagales bacterium]
MGNLEQKISERVDSGSLRALPKRTNAIDFSSNDYLGLARNKTLYLEIEKDIRSKKTDKQLNGATGSRLLSGNNEIIEQIERSLAQRFDASACLLFNSGYNANLSILSCLPQKSDTIIYDELIHASLIDGARLSYAKRFSFRHNDLEDLEKKLKHAQGEIYVVVESIYSMDGDECVIEEIIQVSQRYNAKLIVDEAHSTGVWGELGNGWLCNKKTHHQIFARIYTFGKAIGLHGACICGSEDLKTYLINFARPFIYTTALPIAHYIAIETTFNYLSSNLYLQKQLFANIDFFQKNMTFANSSINQLMQLSNSAIQIIPTPGNGKARKIAAQLAEHNFDVKAILSPTVAEGKERLRVCLHSFNTEEEILGFSNILKTIL